MAKKSTIFSVFGQVQGVVADAMVAEGKARKIEFADIPPSVAYDDSDRPAHCALIMSHEAEMEFNRRVRALLA